MNYTLRSYTQDDYQFVWDFHIKENWPYIQRHSTLTAEQAQELFNQNIAQQNGYMVEAEDRIIGCYFLQEFPDCIKLSRFFIVEDMQKQGLGSHLLVHIMDDKETGGKPIQISVWEDNPVMNFWIKKGFSAIDNAKLTTLVYQGDTK